MGPMTKGDLERILARRARFVGASITMLGCSPTARPANVAVIEPIDASLPAATATVADPVRDAGMPDVHRGATFAIPSGITPETRTRYETLDTRMVAIRKTIADLDRDISSGPKCPSSVCDEFWRGVAGRLETISQSINWIAIHCPNPKREETDRFLEIAQRQQVEAREEREALAERVAKAVGGQARLDRYQREYDTANPRPCLSIRCDSW